MKIFVGVLVAALLFAVPAIPNLFRKPVQIARFPEVAFVADLAQTTELLGLVQERQ